MKKGLSDFKESLLPFFIGLLVLALDIVVKWKVHVYFPPFLPWKTHEVFSNFYGVDFYLTYVKNTGAACGTLAGYQNLLMGIRIVIITMLLIYALFINRRKEVSIPLALIIAGAFGNVLDYYFYGHVVDMFLFRFGGWTYPVFNIADAAITIGIAWWIILSLNKK